MCVCVSVCVSSEIDKFNQLFVYQVDSGAVHGLVCAGGVRSCQVSVVAKAAM